MRYRCIVSYDGSPYYGYQRQSKFKTIQGEIERILKYIYKEEVLIHACSRTDAGVHAIGQVFHYDAPFVIPEDRLLFAINNALPNSIYIKDLKEVSIEFHARRDALSKIYHYKISLKEYDPLLANYCLQYKRKLNLDLMIDASKVFIGKHDFTTFSSKRFKTDKEVNNVREIYEINFCLQNDHLVVEFMGSGFLRYMVRMLVGSLLKVSEGKITKDDLIRFLDAKDSSICPYKAKPEGLYLIKVNY